MVNVHTELKRYMVNLGLSAAKQGDVDILKSHIGRGMGLLYLSDLYGNYLLSTAIEAGREEAAKYLAGAIAKHHLRKVEPNLRFVEPVVCAITRNITEVIEPLLEQQQHGPPIERALEYFSKELQFPSSDYKDGPEWNGKILPVVQVLRLLLKLSCYADETVIQAALGKQAIKNGQTLINILLESGDADINWEDKEGNTALSKAIGGRAWDLVRLLLRYKCHVDYDNIAKYSSFDAMQEFDKMFETLATEGQTPIFLKGDKENRIFQAIREGNTRVLKKLLRSDDFELNVQRGVSPLHVATFYKQMEVCQMLVTLGADAIAKDICFDTPAQYAIKNNDSSLLTLFFSIAEVIDDALATAVTEDNDFSLPIPATSFLQYLVLLEAADLPISDLSRRHWQELKSRLRKVVNCHEECLPKYQKELVAMKIEKISVDRSLFDILTASESELARLAGNETLIGKVLAGGYSQQFPGYNRMITSKMNVGKLRREYFVNGCESMQKMFPNLPVLCIEKMLYPFCNKDLLMLSIGD